jgi:cell division protein FtsB
MDQSLELKLSLMVCIALTGAYIVYDLATQPSGGHPVGYSLGILGALLMVSTETLYSMRKRIGWLKRAGPLRWWLSLHIFTGIVGPFMVLMHTGLKFQGLAGLTMGLTVLVVASGFLGRYLFTAIPRSLAGVESTPAELAAALKQIKARVAELASQQSSAVQAFVRSELGRPSMVRGDLPQVLLRALDEWQDARQIHRQVKQLEKAEQRRLGELERLLTRRRHLERQIHTLDAARRMLNLWHIAHVPMGLALFGSVAIHVVATFYFGAGPLWQLR